MVFKLEKKAMPYTVQLPATVDLRRVLANGLGFQCVQLIFRPDFLLEILI